MVRALLAVAALIFVVTPAIGANRCVDAKGRVTYQDAACDGAAGSRPVDTGDAFSTRPGRTQTPATVPAGQGSSTDPAYATFRGAWRGPAQLRLTVAGTRDDPAGVTPTVLEIKPNGEVAGFIGEGGCKVSGLASQFIAPHIASLSLNLSGCPDSRFSGRYSGQISAIASSQEGRLSLSSVSSTIGRMQITQIDAVLKR